MNLDRIGLLKSRFIRNIIVIFSGSVIAQAIGFFFAPAITRLYGPEVFGIFGIFISLVYWFQRLSSFQYTEAILLPKDDQSSIDIASLVIYLSLFFSLLLFAVFYFFGETITIALGIEDITLYILFIPIAVFAGVMQDLTRSWSLRGKLFKLISKISVLQALVLNASKTLIGIFYPIAFSLIIIFIICSFLYSILHFITAKLYGFPLVIRRLSTNRACQIAKEYKDFPLYLTPRTFLESSAEKLPIILLGIFIGTFAAGWYSLSNKLINMPTSLIRKAAADVFYQRFAEAYNKKNSTSILFIKMTVGLAIIGIIPLMLFFIASPHIFGYVFGDEWEYAGYYARWLSLQSFFILICSPSFAVTCVLKLNRWRMILGFIFVPFRILALITGLVYFKNDILGIILLSLATSLEKLIIIGKMYISCIYADHDKQNRSISTN